MSVTPDAASRPAVVAFLAARAVPGIEEVTPGGRYRRTLRLDHGVALLELGDPDGVAADPRDRPAAEAALARLRGSDETAAAADAHLRSDPILGPLVAARPGLRIPGTADGGELAVRAVLGQQVSVAAARTLAGRLVAMAGDPVPRPDGTLTQTWPRPEAIADVAAALPMPRARQRAVGALARALAAGLMDSDRVVEELLALPGIGPWTAQYVALRALGDPDAWMPTDLGVRHALERLGARPEDAEAWRPFRAHAVAHLWASL